MDLWWLGRWLKGRRQRPGPRCLHVYLEACDKRQAKTCIEVQDSTACKICSGHIPGMLLLWWNLSSPFIPKTADWWPTVEFYSSYLLRGEGGSVHEGKQAASYQPLADTGSIILFHLKTSIFSPFCYYRKYECRSFDQVYTTCQDSVCLICWQMGKSLDFLLSFWYRKYACQHKKECLEVSLHKQLHPGWDLLMLNTVIKRLKYTFINELYNFLIFQKSTKWCLHNNPEIYTKS